MAVGLILYGGSKLGIVHSQRMLLFWCQPIVGWWRRGDHGEVMYSFESWLYVSLSAWSANYTLRCMSCSRRVILEV